MTKRKSSIHFLVGSSYGESVDENAVQLINHIRNNGFKCYFVSNSIPDYDKKFHLSRGNFNTVIKALQANALFYTHSPSDIIPHSHKLHFLKKFLKFPYEVFLQHGIIGLKSKNNTGLCLKSYVKYLDKSFDLMIVSSDWEKRLVENMGVEQHKIKVTGLPRFDRYKRYKLRKNMILLFFTWQKIDSLSSKLNLIRESKAVKKLQDQGFELIEVHHQMQLKNSKPSNLRNNHELLNSAILNCALIITDDSSAAWDVLYQGGEAIFFQPHSQWLNNFDWLQERVAYDLDELDNKLSLAVTGNSKIPIFTKYTDNKNSKRVFDLVSSR